MRTRTLRAWSWVHRWSSLVSTLFLLMLCVTGLPLVFSHEIDEVLLHQDWQPAAEGRQLDLDQVLEAALARHPGGVPAFMSFDEDRPVVNVTSVQPGGKAGVGPGWSAHVLPCGVTMVTHRRVQAAAGPLSRAGEGWGEE